MKIRAKVEACLNCSKITAIVVSLVWLFFVTRYLEIKPEYATREYLRQFQENQKTNGIVRMASVTGIKLSKLSNAQMVSQGQHQGPPDNIFYFFKFLQLLQNKNRLRCESELHALIINANYKQIGDSYLSLYKQLEKQSPYCRHTVYQLTRKDHLLTNSEILMSHYAMQVALAIQMLVYEIQGKGKGNGRGDGENGDGDVGGNGFGKKRKLIVLGFEEGSVILLKAMQYLKVDTINKLGSLMLINAYNPNIQILYQPPYRYIRTIQHNLLRDPHRLYSLNQTQLIFISTTNFWDPTLYTKQQQDKFTFLFEGRRLHNTISLSTRFMKNVHMLMHERDYFGYGGLVARLVKFMLMDPGYFRKIQAVEYFFLYGELYVKIDQQYSIIKKKNCHNSLLSNLNKVTKILSTYCLTVHLQTKMKQKMVENCTGLIVISKKSYMFNHKFEKLEPMFETNENLYFIFERMGQNNQLNIINPNRSETVMVQFQRPNGPDSFPLPDEIILSSGPNMFLQTPYKQSTQNRKLIKICPDSNLLIYPQNFYNIYPDSTLITSLGIYTLNKLVTDFTQSTQNFELDCYVDSTHITIVPKQFMLNWWRERNIVMLVLVYGYACKDGIYGNFYFYFWMVWVIRYYLGLDSMMAENLLLLTLAVLVEKCIQLILHLVKFIQQMLDLKYRKFIILLIFVPGLLKIISQNFIQLLGLSSWKMLFISLIFLINKQNVHILLIKIYYLMDCIVYGHDDMFELTLFLFWIYSSFMGVGVGEEQRDENGETMDKDKEVRRQNGRTIKQRQSILKQLSMNSFEIIKMAPTSVSFLDTLLVLAFFLLIEGPSYLQNTVLTLYILLKSLGKMWGGLRVSLAKEQQPIWQ